MMTDSESAEVAMKYVDIRRGKPPSASIFFDVILHNHDSQARWFLLPVLISPTSQVSDGGVSGVEVYEYSGHGRVVMGNFFGNGGFKAFLLPAGTEVQLHRLAITSWDTMPDAPLSIAVITASHVSINGQPAESWFNSPPLSDDQADVAADQGKQVSARYAPDSKELPVTFEGKRTLTLQVSLH